MERYARWLFGTAALFNFVAGLSLLFLRPLIGPYLRLDAAAGTNLVFVDFTGAIIALFGFGYLRLARGPAEYRPYISFSVIGKSLAVLCVAYAWTVGAISWVLPLLVSADIVFAILFLDFLRRTRTT